MSFGPNCISNGTYLSIIIVIFFILNSVWLFYLHFFLQKGTTNRFLKALEREPPFNNGSIDFNG
jgi:hypothetical protein